MKPSMTARVMPHGTLGFDDPTAPREPERERLLRAHPPKALDVAQGSLAGARLAPMNDRSLCEAVFRGLAFGRAPGVPGDSVRVAIGA